MGDFRQGKGVPLPSVLAPYVPRQLVYPFLSASLSLMGGSGKSGLRSGQLKEVGTGGRKKRRVGVQPEAWH